MTTKSKRRKADAYMTPVSLASAITSRLRQTLVNVEGRLHQQDFVPRRVLEPSAGDGAFVEAARGVWSSASVTAIELRNTTAKKLLAAGAAHVHPGQNFLTWGPTYAYDLVIGNPPYLQAEKHIEAAMECVLGGGFVAMLLRLSFLGSQERAAGLWTRWPLYALHPIAQRPQFTTKGSDNSEYGLFVWKHGHSGVGKIYPHIWWR